MEENNEQDESLQPANKSEEINKNQNSGASKSESNKRKSLLQQGVIKEPRKSSGKKSKQCTLSEIPKKKSKSPKGRRKRGKSKLSGKPCWIRKQFKSPPGTSPSRRHTVHTKMITMEDLLKSRQGAIEDECPLDEPVLEDSSSSESDEDTEGEEDMEVRKTQTKSVTYTVIRKLDVRPNKYTVNLSRRLKMTLTLYRPFIITDGVIDYTPKRAIKPGDTRWVQDPMLFSFPDERFSVLNADNLHRDSSKPKLDFAKRTSHMKSSVNSDDNFKNTTIVEDDMESEITVAPPTMFNVVHPVEPPIDKMCLKLRIKETETIILFSMTSQASVVGDAEGKNIEQENELFNQLSKRLRKSINNYSQTSMIYESNRIKETQLSSQMLTNSYAYVSNWDYYDTLKNCEPKPVIEPPRPMIGKVENIIYADDKSIYEPIKMYNFKADRLNWYKTCMIMERVLLSNNAMRRQLIFHNHFKSDPMSEKIEFKYRFCRLWTLRTEQTKGRTVTSMSFNLCVHNIFAVGYGKYHFSQKLTGLVYIWNNKNLANPEREYNFEHPVTSLKFCKTFPNILAVAFYSGLVALIDINKHHGIKYIAQSMPFNQTSVYPVWQVTWITKVSSERLERVIECWGNGCIYEYTNRHLYEKKLIMKITKVKGLVKGIHQQKLCQPYVIPLVRHPAVLCIALHPTDINLYYLGSNEGAVYKCCLQDVHQHMEMFIAHNGPVYTIQFHPACAKIFLTCGADWCIRVWGDGILTPLITMVSGMSTVQSACWCPNYPTVIANITSSKVELWDISRRVNVPQASEQNPFGVLNTSMRFSVCGNNLCIGDIDGNLHVYTMKDMPFSPMNPDLVLAMALLKALIPHPKLLGELKKLGPPFNVSRIYKNLINI